MDLQNQNKKLDRIENFCKISNKLLIISGRVLANALRDFSRICLKYKNKKIRDCNPCTIVVVSSYKALESRNINQINNYLFPYPT